MKKIYIVLGLVVLFSVGLVLALTKPQPLTVMSLTEIEQPIAPGTDIQGECNPWDIKDEYCNRDIRHYTQCIKTVSGGIWQINSENCEDYGENVKCSLGKCRKFEDRMKAILYAVLSITIIIAVLWLVIWLIKRKR